MAADVYVWAGGSTANVLDSDGLNEYDYRVLGFQPSTAIVSKAVNTVLKETTLASYTLLTALADYGLEWDIDTDPSLLVTSCKTALAKVASGISLSTSSHLVDTVNYGNDCYFKWSASEESAFLAQVVLYINDYILCSGICNFDSTGNILAISGFSGTAYHNTGSTSSTVVAGFYSVGRRVLSDVGVVSYITCHQLLGDGSMTVGQGFRPTVVRITKLATK